MNREHAAKGSILVTGGNGYIGQHFCRHMARIGHEVLIIDDHSTSPTRNMHPYGTFFRGDIADPKIWKDLMLKQKNPLKAVVHFASRAIVSESERQEKTFEYLEENLIKGAKALQLAIEHGVEHWVQSSTCATYGMASNQSQLTEESIQAPMNTYGFTKLLLEQVLKEAARKYPIKVGILRYFNAAGCCPDSELGEHHHPETHLIPNLVKVALKIKNNLSTEPFYLYGNTFETKDGSCVRDFIHVEDLAWAHEQLLEKLFMAAPGVMDFNLGSGVGHSVLELIGLTEKIIGKKIPVKIMPARAGDPAYLVASNQKATRELGLKLRYSVQDCIEHTFKYIEKNININ